VDWVKGWAEVRQGFGDPEHGVRPTLFVVSRCGRLIETLPALQHDPNRPENVLKVDADEEGVGGDDCADCLRYMVATKVPTFVRRRLTGW
jgi:phage terminase large subunit